MFTRVRVSLLLWNLLIIGAIMLAAGSVAYVSQRRSLLSDADRLLAQSAAALPKPVVSGDQPPASLDQPVPFTLVVDSTGRVLVDPQRLGVTDISLPTVSTFTIGGRLRVQLGGEGIHLETVQREQRLFLFQKTSSGALQGRSIAIAVPSGQNAAYVQTISTGTIQGRPVRLLLEPVVLISAGAPADAAPPQENGTALPGEKSVQPNAFLVTGVSLAPVEQSLNRTMAILLAGGAAGLLLSLLGSWFLAGRALIPIEKAFRRQQEFVADAAHELRTPLTILQTSTHLLNQHRDEPLAAQGRVFDDLHEEIGRLTRLTCDLLDLARSDTGQLELALGRVDLDELGRKLVRRLSAVAAERQIELRFEGSARALVVDADSDRLQQALLALLDNALKHTPPGGAVTLAVSDSGRSATVEVRDTGEGIPPEVLGRVFDRFYRGDAVRSRSTGGAGLGLAIARTLVEAHGGTLALSSALGSGTTATVHLPLTAEAPTTGPWSRARELVLRIGHLF